MSNILIENLPYDNIHIFIDNPKEHLREIRNTQGVIWADVIGQDLIILKVSPRFDKNEIIKSLENLLNSEVPRVFKE